MNPVWIIDDDSSIRWVLEKALTAEGIEWRSFADVANAQTQLKREPPAVVLSDVRMPGMNGLDWLAQIKRTLPDIPVIIMTAFSDLDTAVTAFQQGAYEYLPKPFDIDQALSLVKRALAEQPKRLLNDANDANEAGDAPSHTPSASMSDLLGQAPAMQAVFRSIGKLAPSSATVLITGESGTGKELVAQALHRHSLRKDRPFIALNTAAIPKDLLESELFGHERGAFTGAAAMRKGRFEQAQGGTLFLDEIGDMPAELQTRLLRVLAEGQFYRVGGTSAVTVDVRVIAATHQALEERVTAGLFREDLFHRLNVIRLRLPALRERVEDIALLAQHFLDKAAKQLSVEVKRLMPDAVAVMQSFNWSGNVRQLENVCQWLTVMAASQQIGAQDLPPELQNITSSNVLATAQHVQLAVQFNSSPSPSLNPNPTPNPSILGIIAPKHGTSLVSEAQGAEALPSGANWMQLVFADTTTRLQAGEINIIDTLYQQLESVCINAALAHTKGHKSEAAQRLGLGRNTLARKAKQ
jgi:two-component system, NtrC family, nitrogen regulation response regulator GlnG